MPQRFPDKPYMELRTDPSCLSICTTATYVPVLLSAFCVAANTAVARGIATPHVLAVAAACDAARLLRLFQNPYVAAGSLYLSLEGKDWCETKFCLPPSGKAKE